MTAYRLEPDADRSLDRIYDFTADRWGPEQADRYIAELFEAFGRIASRAIVWHPVPKAFGVDAFHARCGSHIIYWRADDIDGVAIIAILHERMNQGARLAADLT